MNKVVFIETDGDIVEKTINVEEYLRMHKLILAMPRRQTYNYGEYYAMLVQDVGKRDKNETATNFLAIPGTEVYGRALIIKHYEKLGHAPQIIDSDMYELGSMIKTCQPSKLKSIGITGFIFFLSCMMIVWKIVKPNK